jgi:N-acyl-D-aspartate/D-glutamate deacylase
MLDLIIRGGEVVDGTGAPGRVADVGVEGGRISVIGDLGDTEAATTIDATGKVVAPGFIDVHTHYDAQVFWDGSLSPSPLHGVTTVLAGNCGFTIAPLSGKPADGEYMMRMLARVEGMPIEALAAGVPWNWTTTADYFAAIEGNLGVNAGFMVGHSALRRVVMGEEANQREATEDEVAAMTRLLDEGIEAGGIGFSSSWARTHNDGDGHMVPSRYATREELLALASAAGDHEGTSLELIPMVAPAFEPWAIDIMADMSVAAQRPLNWNVLAVTARSAAQAAAKLEAGDVARRRGGKVIALTIPQSFGIRLSFASGFVLDAIPGWEDAMLLPRADKMALFRDPAARERLDALAKAPDNPMRFVCDWASKRIFDVAADENRAYVGRTVGEIATDQGREPWDVLCDIAVADELLTSFGNDMPPDSDDDWKARAEIWRDARAVIGASDAGAHLDLFATFNYTTALLGATVRERSLLSMEEAVHLLTDVPARLYGLVERGQLQPGWHADIVVIDPATVASDEVSMRYDLPGGAARLYAGAQGIDDVIVNGTAIVRNGALTNARTGSLLRSGRDTRTPSLDLGG